MIFKSSGFNENRFRILLALQVGWLFIILILGSWWAYFITSQSEEIFQLSIKLGVSESIALENKNKTTRMIYWEIITFFIFIIGSSLLMFWLYWKDLKRTQGLAHFFSALTHEIKTPLTSIRLQAESLEETLLGNDQAKKLLNRLLEDSGKLENQVIRSLELARLEGGGQLYLQSIPLKKTIEKSIKNFLDSLPKTDEIKIEVKCNENENILSDIYSLETLFRNFLENSLKHTKERPLKIKISSHTNNGWTEIQYEDNGSLSQIHEKNLGTLFLRGAHSKGAGIGLYLCKIITEKMHGKISYKKKQNTNSLLITLSLKSTDPSESES